MTALSSKLPVTEALPALLAALANGGAAVLVAPPGAGKTTLVPLALLDAPWRGEGRIIMLEPRRLAARAAAHRMAQLLCEEVGQRVGYRVRLDSRISAATRIEVVTEGVFTRMVIDDPELTGIAAVIFDEFHERSLDGDLGLALALEARILRDDLRLLVMSATIDGASVARLLDDAPVITSEGRAFPVETRYVDRAPDARLEDQVAALVMRALGEATGSILVFLPGQAEIQRTAERLEARLPQDTDLAPLYGQLTQREQDLAISPSPPGRRKVVLATSIAETSLTIEGVRIVIDSGYARKPAYDPSTGLTSLTTPRVSRAAADQRRGRAGRIEPGLCYRLWNERQTQALAAFDPPEIQGADLTGLALDLASWGVTDPRQMQFLDSPPETAWREATSLLRRLEAINEPGHITATGKVLARLPLHPRLAHMVSLGARDGDAETAAELAVLVTERGLAGNDMDLAERLRKFRADRSRRAQDGRTLAQRWARLARDGSTSKQPAKHSLSVGAHLARAYPDRIAQATGTIGDLVRFRLANGRSADLDALDRLAREPYLVVTDVTGVAARGRIRAAAAIDRETVEAEFADQITSETTLAFDERARAVRARRRRMLGALRLEDAPAPIADQEAAAQVLAEGIAAIGIDTLPWSKAQRALRARSTYLASEIGGDWPDLSATALAAATADWLAPHIIGSTALAEITADDLQQALDTILPWHLRSEMDRLLPTHFAAPSGSSVPIDYDAENGPALEIRVQELFGLDAHPSIAGGKVPLLLVLLSPAHRPIQTTRDLPGFWRGSWRDVAKDLKGRYPKHYWPDDPLAAQPTARAKPRGT